MTESTLVKARELGREHGHTLAGLEQRVKWEHATAFARRLTQEEKARIEDDFDLSKPTNKRKISEYLKGFEAGALKEIKSQMT